MGSGFGTEYDPWVDSGSYTLANGYGTKYDVGPVFEFAFGVDLDDNWSLELDAELSYFLGSQVGISSVETSLVPCVQYNLDHAWATPYFKVGCGLNINDSNTPAGTYTGYTNNGGNYYQTADTNGLSVLNPVLCGGVGVLIENPWTSKIQIYVQALYDMSFTSRGDFSYFPITAGLRFQ